MALGRQTNLTGLASTNSRPDSKLYSIATENEPESTKLIDVS